MNDRVVVNTHELMLKILTEFVVAHPRIVVKTDDSVPALIDHDLAFNCDNVFPLAGVCVLLSIDHVLLSKLECFAGIGHEFPPLCTACCYRFINCLYYIFITV
jgi:hypothetical protein